MKQQVITASVFIQKGNQVLLVKRSDTETFAPGHWELPGGHVEYDETVQDALRREAKEETGLDVNIIKVFYEFTYTIPEEEKHYIELIYLGVLKKEDQEIILNPNEHSEYKWVRRKEFEKEFSDIFDKEYEAILEGFKLISQ